MFTRTSSRREVEDACTVITGYLDDVMIILLVSLLSQESHGLGGGEESN